MLHIYHFNIINRPLSNFHLINLPSAWPFVCVCFFPRDHFGCFLWNYCNSFVISEAYTNENEICRATLSVLLPFQPVSIEKLNKLVQKLCKQFKWKGQKKKLSIHCRWKHFISENAECLFPHMLGHTLPAPFWISIWIPLRPSVENQKELQTQRMYIILGSRLVGHSSGT